MSRRSRVDAGRRLYCNLGDVTNLAVARGSTCLFTRVSSFGVEGIAQKLAERRQLTLEHARQWLVHVGLEQPIEQIEGDRETSRRPRGARRGRRQARRRAAALARVLRRPGGRGRGRGRRRLRARDDDPGPRRAPPARPRPALRDRPPARARAPRRRRGRPPDPVLRPGAGGVAVRPVNLIPPEERRGERAPARTRRARLRRRRASSRSALVAVTAVVLTNNRSPIARPRSPSLEQQEAEAQPSARAASAPTPSSRPSSRLASRRSRPLAQSRFDWERVLRELCARHPRATSG